MTTIHHHSIEKILHFTMKSQHDFLVKIIAQPYKSTCKLFFTIE
uniref:Uncharacterized protein n=1 Tax=Arundo donax TaxID=35708 RepID=A0A0A8YFF0_ARUDO